MVFLFDFIFPGFLWAMFLLSVPLLIHLFYFRRYKRQYFSNVLLLKQLQEKRSTRNQLKYWLVLISRLLILIFLVLAFSQPFLGTDNIADNSKWTSIYIDNSFSMSLDDGSGSLLSKAVRFAKEHVFNNDAATKYQILSNGILLKKKQFVDKQGALEAIDRIDLMPSNMPLEEIYNQQLNNLDDKKGDKKIIWFSDFQKNKDLKLTLNQDIKHYSHQLSTKNISNVYVDTCWIDPSFAELGRNTDLIVRLGIKNKSLKENIMRMEIRLNGEIKAIKNIKLKEDQILDTTNIVFNSVSWNQITIKIEDYPYVLDNTYYACFKVSEKIKVLSVYENKESKAIASVLEQENINHDLMQINKLDMKKINDYSLIILDGIDRLSENMITVLSQHVSSGGDMALFPSENIDAASYERLSKRLDIGSFVNLQQKESQIFNINLRSKLLNRVFKKIPKKVSWPEIKKHFPIIHMGSEAGEAIMSFSDRSAIAYEYNKGLARVFLFSIGTDTTFSNLTNHAIFAPLLYNMVLQSEALNQNQLILGKNYSVSLKFLKSMKEDKLRLVKEEFESVPSFQYINGEKQLLLSDNIKEMGFYTLKNNARELSRFAFNHNKAESELNYYTSSELQDHFYEVLDKEEVVSATVNKNKTELWKVCLIFVLSFIMLETIFLKYL